MTAKSHSLKLPWRYTGGAFITGVALKFGNEFSLSFLLSACLLASSAFPQSTLVKTSFEVSTVKPASLDMTKLAEQMQSGKMPKLGFSTAGDRAEFTYMSLRDLITVAYKVKPYQITGPSWLTRERFDIVATLPEGAAKDAIPAMLQNLLVGRFALKAHSEQQQQAVLALVVRRAAQR
jgi:hypothetical protein